MRLLLNIVMSSVMVVTAAPSFAQDDTLREDFARSQEEKNRYRVDGQLKSDQPDAPLNNVTILLEISDMRIRRQIAYERTVTLPNGSFSFDLSKHADIPELGLQFNTLSPRYREARKIEVVKADELPFEFTLDMFPGAAAHGKVVAQDGTPLPDVTISSAGCRDVTTDREGEFELFGLPPDQQVYVRAALDGYADGVATVTSEGPSLIDGVNFTLLPAFKLIGKVLDPTGAPLPKGEATLQLENRYVRKKIVDGAFTMDAVPSKLEGSTVRVSAPGFASRTVTLTSADSEAKSVSVTLEWPLKLTGKVLGPDGKVASGVSVQARTADGVSVAETTTDADGTFIAAPLPTGMNFVLAAFPSDPSGRQASGELEFHKESTPGKWDGDVKPWPGGYESTFTATVAGSDVTMERRDTGRGALPGVITYKGKFAADGRSMSGTLTVEATGAPGEWSARAYDGGSTLKGVWDLRERIGTGKFREAPVLVEADGAPFPASQYVDLKLGTPKSLGGRILDKDGAPLSNGIVAVTSWQGTDFLKRSAPLALGGKFTLDGLADGVLEIAIMDEQGNILSSGNYTRAGIDDWELRIGSEDDDPASPLPVSAP